MRILVTGGSGAIGAYVIKDLLDHGFEPTILDAREPRVHKGQVPFVQCDLMDLPATIEAIKGYDVVVHLAAIPTPFNDPPDRVLGVNMVTCFNVLEAVRLNEIPRIVYGCSESSTGFGIHNVELEPLYLPIDEAHPCWPHESYSFSKRFGEVMTENYARAYGIEAISLRYCWVWLERDADAIHTNIAAGLRGEMDPKNWFGGFIAPHDVAQAVRLAASYEFAGDMAFPFEAFYFTAETTFLPVPTLEALASHFDPMPEIRSPEYYAENPFAPPFDIRKAKRLLGFKPTKDWRTFDAWEKP